MTPVRTAAIALVPALLALAGCVHQESTPELSAGQTTEEPAREAHVVWQVDVTHEEAETEGSGVEVGADVSQPTASEKAPSPPPAPPPAAPPSAPGRRAAPEPVLFHLGAGYGILGQVDLRPCREQGLQAGYLHMRVTFRSSGQIVRAAVESSASPPPEALACIREKLELAMVPTFEGGDVTLSKSFFVN